MRDPLDVIVIGAGNAGLCALRQVFGDEAGVSRQRAHALPATPGGKRLPLGGVGALGVSGARAAHVSAEQV